MFNEENHDVICVDVVKYAEVSTGIIYQYFKDKQDIFIEGTKDYANKIMFPMLNIINQTQIDRNHFEELLSNVIDSFINTHTMKKEAHEELMVMSHLDSDVACINEMLYQYPFLHFLEFLQDIVSFAIVFLQSIFQLIPLVLMPLEQTVEL